MTIVDRAYKFAENAYAGRKDIFGDEQINHAAAVAELFEDEEIKAAALLHDVLRMNSASYGQLLENFGANIADMVSALTPKQDEPMHMYVARIRENRAAREIKLAELHRDMDLSKKRDAADTDMRERDKRLRLLYQLSM